MELTATGTPSEVEPVIARARRHGHLVRAEPLGSGRLRVTVGQPPAVRAEGTRPVRAHQHHRRRVRPVVIAACVAGALFALAGIGALIALVVKAAVAAIAAAVPALVVVAVLALLIGRLVGGGGKHCPGCRD